MKEHKGKLEDWQKFYTYGDDSEVDGYIIVGLAIGHERFDGHVIRTSSVVGRKGDEIETLNSRYTLGNPLHRLESYLDPSTRRTPSMSTMSVRPSKFDDDPAGA